MPGWLQSLLAIGEHLQTRLGPLWTLFGAIVPVLVLSFLLVLGFEAYEKVRTDPNAVEFLTCIIGAMGGIWVFLGVLGVAFMVFLVAWFAMWQAFNR